MKNKFFCFCFAFVGLVLASSSHSYADINEVLVANQSDSLQTGAALEEKTLDAKGYTVTFFDGKEIIIDGIRFTMKNVNYHVDKRGNVDKTKIDFIASNSNGSYSVQASINADTNRLVIVAI